MVRVGWIGIGLMGIRMLPHIVRAGHPTVVYARDREAARQLPEAGTVAAESPAEVASSADVIFTIVSTPADVAAVYMGPDGLFAGARPGSVLVDMTTSSPELARRIAAESGAIDVYALDAPVSGGVTGAEAATLSIMIGGETPVVERVRPLLQLLGTTIVHHGPAGAGQSAKIANQIALGGAMLGICEAFLFASASGLRSETVLETLSGGIAGSDLLRYLWPRIAAGDLEPGFRIEHLIKDLELALDASEEADVALPGTTLVRELCRQAVAAGHSGKGSQALITALDRGWELRH